MNCRKRMTSAGSGSKQVNKDPSKKGNPVSKLGDKHGMEYKPVKRDPNWDGADKKVTWPS